MDFVKAKSGINGQMLTKSLCLAILAEADARMTHDGALVELCRPLTRLARTAQAEEQRENAFHALRQLLGSSKDVRPFMGDVLPCIADALGHNGKVPREKAEEIRYAALDLCRATIDKLIPNVPGDDLFAIVRPTLTDSFAEVQKLALDIVALLCHTCPAAAQRRVPEMLPAVMRCITRKIAAVRVRAVRALQSIVQVVPCCFKECILPLKRQLTEVSAVVRSEIYTLAGNWLISYPDRYSHASSILYLLLHGLSGHVDSEEVQNHCHNMAAAISKQYESDWPKTKDAMDFAGENGFLHLVRDNVMNVSLQIVEDLRDWKFETRLCAARVLCKFLDYAGPNITAYLDKLLPAIETLMSELSPLKKTAEDVMAKIGFHAAMDVILQVLMPRFETSNVQLMILHSLRHAKLSKTETEMILRSTITNADSSSDPMKRLYLAVIKFEHSDKAAFLAGVNITNSVQFSDVLLRLGVFDNARNHLQPDWPLMEQILKYVPYSHVLCTRMGEILKMHAQCDILGHLYVNVAPDTCETKAFFAEVWPLLIDKIRWSSKPAKQRELALKITLRHITPELTNNAFVSAVETCLDDYDAGVRLAAAHVAAYIAKGPQKDLLDINLVIRLLEDTVDIRLLACGVLANLSVRGNLQVLECARVHAMDDNSDVRAAALRVIDACTLE